ncbi:MAG: chemotaxis protein CheW [Oscillospiraceae bacterium]|nr:chemotaxis protein CheW [Oscillospiraceae bacterium]
MAFATEDQQLAAWDAMQVSDTVDTQKFLIFLTDELKFGIDAENVVEIITSYSITYLPMVPDYIRGIINLRGQMVPIWDVRLRLGKEEKEDCLIVVLNIDGTYLGVLVDSVDQMIDIPRTSMLPVPAHNAQQLVSGMCTLPDGSGTMMVLDCDQLLHE